MALPPLRPAAFFCAVVPPCFEEERDEPECDFLPPRLEAPGEFAIFAARSFDIPFSFSASYCFSFLTDALLPGISGVFPCSERPNTSYILSMEPREDSWESIGWAQQEDLDREQVLQLARRVEPRWEEVELGLVTVELQSGRHDCAEEGRGPQGRQGLGGQELSGDLVTSA